MTTPLDDLMEIASQALADMDYARCESLCVEALGQASEQNDWVIYQRVLLPLQEARRQRRQAALDGPVLLGTINPQSKIESQIKGRDQGCVVLTWPSTPSDLLSLSGWVRENKRPIELLFADNTPETATWKITSTSGPVLSIDLPAPKQDWIGRWVDPSSLTPPTPAHWFMQASEALGDAALAAIEPAPDSLDYLRALEAALSCVDDHEILHQRLASAAKAIHKVTQ
ncbi:MAG: hypothetical protein AAF711_12135 [Planctomycetota bacterium]